MNGELAMPPVVLEAAKKQPQPELGDWWLSRRRYIEPGDRIWIYFRSPEKKVAALAIAESKPREVGEDPDFPWRFQARLHRQATIALHRSPVPLAALTNQHPQGVTRVKPQDLSLLLKRAGV